MRTKNEISFTEKIHFDNKDTSHGPRTGKETVQRNIVQCFAQHKQTKKYLLLKRKQSDRVSPVGGGIGEGQTIEDAIKTELLQEAGYKEVDNISLISSNVSFESYVVHKDRNVYGHTTIVYCEIDGDPEPISEYEREVHEPFFADEDEVEGLLNIGNLKYLWQQYLVWREK